MTRFQRFGTLAISGCLTALAGASETAQITILADKPLFRLSELMIGANMEDLHYQMTGGLSSQLIHGESFFEPTPTEVARACQPFEGFTARGGIWTLEGDELSVRIGKPDSADAKDIHLAGNGTGARLSTDDNRAQAKTSVEVRFPAGAAGPAGLALHIQPNEADEKWQWFSGYTIRLDPKSQKVVLLKSMRANKHQEVQSAACAVPADTWVRLDVTFRGNHIDISVNGKPQLSLDDDQPLPEGRMGLFAQGNVRFRNLILDEISPSPIAFKTNPLLTAPGDAISMRWAKVRTGSAVGSFAMEETGGWHPGKRSQSITFTGGTGELGIDNAGLKRWGLHIVKNKPYEGFLRVKSGSPSEIWVALRDANHGKVYAERKLAISGKGDYERLAFSLTPDSDDADARFSVTLKQPSSVTVGYVFLQPGEWGRYKGLPIRKDLAEAVVGQGIRVLRMNGGMIERPDYRWHNMQGPRDQRPPYDGFYDRWCGNGFGVIEFLQFCDAAGLTGVTGLNLDETPEDVADFIAYANAPEDTPAGKRRAADGHPAPFRLKYYQVANESRFDQRYVKKFKEVAEAVWKVDPGITLITTSTSGYSGDDASVAAQKLALHLDLVRFCQERGKKLIFDSHCFKGAGPVAGIAGFGRWIKRLSSKPDDVSVAILEFNAGAFDMNRALSHAQEINAAHLGGDVIRSVGMPNLSQPWGVYQTDWKAVLWTQGNIYYTQDKVWFQPAYYVDRMISRHWAPDVLGVRLTGMPDSLNLIAGKSADGKSLVLRVVNSAADPFTTHISLDGFTPKSSAATIEQLSGQPSDFNTLEQPEKIMPVTRTEPAGFSGGSTTQTFPPHSFTVIEWR